MTFAGLLFKFARSTAHRILGKAEWWEMAGLLFEKEPRLNSRKAENLSYRHLIV
jgi:hypothetical protein